MGHFDDLSEAIVVLWGVTCQSERRFLCSYDASVGALGAQAFARRCRLNAVKISSMMTAGCVCCPILFRPRLVCQVLAESRVRRDLPGGPL